MRTFSSNQLPGDSQKATSGAPAATPWITRRNHRQEVVYDDVKIPFPEA